MYNLSKYSGQTPIQSGQTLVEVLVAMTVGVLVLTAITSSVLTSIVNSRVSGLSEQATQYAQEAIEIARASRAAAAGTYCLGKGETVLTGIPEGTCATPNVDTKFIRTVRVLGNEAGNDCGADVNKTIVSVNWTDSKCAAGTYCHQVTLNSCANVIAAAGTITPTPTLTPTPAPATNSFYPSDDSTVNSGSPTSNYGAVDRITLDAAQTGYLKFDTSSVTGKYVVGAKLQFTEWGSSVNESIILKSASNADSGGTTPWSESTVTYNTRPTVNNPLGSLNFPLNSSTYAIDVSSAFPSPIESAVSFQLSATGDTVYISSKEYSTVANRPLLIVQTATYPGISRKSPVTIVNSTNGTSASVATSTPLSFSHDVSGTNRLLLVAFTSDTDGISISYAGQSLSYLGSDGYTGIRTGYFYMINPPTGTNNIIISKASSIGSPVSAKAITLNNVSQVSPFGSRYTAQNNSGTSSVSPTIYSEANDMIFHSTGLASGCLYPFTVGSSLTELTPQINTNRDLVVGYHLSDGTTFTSSVSWTASCPYGTYIIGIKPVFF